MADDPVMLRDGRIALNSAMAGILSTTMGDDEGDGEEEGVLEGN